MTDSCVWRISRFMHVKYNSTQLPMNKIVMNGRCLPVTRKNEPIHYISCYNVDLRPIDQFQSQRFIFLICCFNSFLLVNLADTMFTWNQSIKFSWHTVHLKSIDQIFTWNQSINQYTATSLIFNATYSFS